MIDTLTNLASKNTLNEKLNSSKHPILFLIDIKDFKLINLKYTDEGGDFILRSFAASLMSFAQKNEMMIFRVIDDEFALLKDMSFDLDLIEKLIFGLLEFISSLKYNFSGSNITIKTNIGISFDLKNSLQKASLALTLAKKENQPFISYSEFATRLLEEKNDSVSKEIETAIDNGFITPYYQRVIDLNGNEIYQEALIRLSLKESLQPPKFFLEIAKKRGFYLSIVELLSQKILSTKITQAVNFSFEDLSDEALLEYLLETYKDSNVIFELQGDFQVDFKQAISKLKSVGIRICLDNTKTTQILKQFDSSMVDFVKVDGDLIRLLNISEESKSTCRDILKECQRLQCKSIASRINSNTSFEESKKLGFDYFQGFFFGKPTDKL